MQRPPTSLDKYRVVPRAKIPVEENEIRISMTGRIPRYVQYAARLFNEKGKKSVTIKATGNAISSAITLAEVLKRRFSNLFQQNVIGVTKSVDTYEPVEVGLDQVTYSRDVPFIEITVALDPSTVDSKAVGYQAPIDQSLVRPLIESSSPTAEDGDAGAAPSIRGRGGRGGYRGRGMRRGGRGRGYGRRDNFGGDRGRGGYDRSGYQGGGGYRRGGRGGYRDMYRGRGAYRGGRFRSSPYRTAAGGAPPSGNQTSTRRQNGGSQ